MIGTSGDTKPYAVWVNYGYEGWRPSWFDSREEVVHFLLSGDYSGEKVVTQTLDVKIEVTVEESK